MKQRVIIFVFLCLQLSIVAQSRATYFLDLTKIQPSSSPGSIESGGVFNPHEKIPMVPLKMTLLALEPTTCPIGGKVTYEVLLENISKEAFTIPWSGDENSTKLKSGIYGNGYLDTFISLSLADSASTKVLLTAQSIYGSNTTPDSLKTLRPGQTARIRIKGNLYLSDSSAADRIVPQLPKKFEITAAYLLSNKPHMLTYDPVVSNSVTITLIK